MIRAEGLTAKAAPVRVHGVTFALEAGVHALLGAREDGVELVLAVLAGAITPGSGTRTVLGKSPSDPEVRRQIAHVPRVPSLPEALDVAEALDLAAALRGEPRRPPEARLSPLGLASLARRRIRTLTPSEARAVAIAEAVTSQNVRVLLVDEPFVGIDPRALPSLPDALRARARDGACVVFATASTRDAGELADTLLLFTQGALVRVAPASEVVSLRATTRLRIVADDPRALLAALAGERALTAMALRGDALLVTGADEVSVAAAVGRAAVRAGIDIRELRPDPAPIEELRAAVAGASAAEHQAAYRVAYEAARERARQAQHVQPAPGSMPPPPHGGAG